jgi:tripartite-type tricarboxylate transporter receptor subunit TctC
MAVTSPRPSVHLPQVPSLASFGLDAASYEGWFAIWAPARTPEDVLQRINAEARAAQDVEAVQVRLRNLAVDPAPLDLAAVRALIKEDEARWQRAADQGFLRRAAG